MSSLFACDSTERRKWKHSKQGGLSIKKVALDPLLSANQSAKPQSTDDTYGHCEDGAKARVLGSFLQVPQQSDGTWVA